MSADNFGTNEPSDPAVAIRQNLDEQYAPLAARRDALLEAAERVPPIHDDESAGKVGDFIKQIAAAIKNGEAARVKEKEPFLAGSRTVDGYFRAITDPLDRVKRAIESRLTTFLREKAERERRARQKAEDDARKEADRLAEAARKAEEAAKTDKGLAKAIEADARAQTAVADLAQAEKRTDAKPAELSRNRGDLGSTASLRTFWDFKNLERASLDLEALRYHLPQDGIEKAVRSLIKSGVRELRGVEIFENTKAAVV